jgi:hypothetical protein
MALGGIEYNIDAEEYVRYAMRRCDESGYVKKEGK